MTVRSRPISIHRISETAEIPLVSRTAVITSDVVTGDGDDLGGSDWDELVTTNVPRVRNFLRTLVAPEDVDDVTQETFSRLQAAHTAGKQIENLRAFIFGIVHNVLREHIRRRLKDPTRDLSNVSALAIDPRPSSMLAREADRIQLLDAMRSLSMDHQIVLQLSFWEGLNKRQIGEILGIPENTVKSRIGRAREELRKKLPSRR